MVFHQYQSIEKNPESAVDLTDLVNKKSSHGNRRSKLVKSIRKDSKLTDKEGSILPTNRIDQELDQSTDFKVVGSIEKIDSNAMVHGWVCCVNDPEQRLQVGIYHDQQMVGWALAHLSRSDLALPVGSGNKVGFQIQLSPAVCNQKAHSLKAYVIGSKLIPFGHPFEFQSAEQKKVHYQGFLDQIRLKKALYSMSESFGSQETQGFSYGLETVCVLMECDYFDAALQLMDKWPALFRDHVLSKLKRAECESKLQKSEVAAQRLIKTVKEHSGQPLAWCLLIDMLIKKEKYSQAEQCFKQLDTLINGHSDIYSLVLGLKLKCYQAAGIEGLSHHQKLNLSAQCQQVLLMDDENRCASALLFQLNQINSDKQKNFFQQQKYCQDLIHETMVLNTWLEILDNLNHS